MKSSGSHNKFENRFVRQAVTFWVIVELYGCYQNTKYQTCIIFLCITATDICSSFKIILFAMCHHFEILFLLGLVVKIYDIHEGVLEQTRSIINFNKIFFCFSSMCAFKFESKLEERKSFFLPF